MSEKPETSLTEEKQIPAEAPEGKKKKRKGRKKRIFKRIIWTLVFLVVLGAVGWSVYSKLQADYRITYDPYTATTGSISNSLSFTGSVQLINSANYTAPSDCKIREVYVSVGDKVKDGDRLMRLSDGTNVEAGFDGTVSGIDVAKNDEVLTGDSLVTIADFEHMEVSVRVGESDISQVSVGQACKVTVSSADVSFDATIDKIDYVSYTGNNVAYYTTTVKLDNSEGKNIWPGMQATVTIPLEEAENVTVLKMEALSTAPDNTAFVYKETASGEMEEVAVTVGVSNGNYVEIKEGVTSGETIYKVAEKEEEATGLAALFSGMFSNTRVNRQSNRNWNRDGSMPDGFPGGGSFPSGGSFPGGGSNSNSNRTNSQPGGSRGN